MRPLLALVLALLVLAPCGARAGRMLRVASEGARPPFNYLDADNRLAGFEIDLMREICKRIDAECEFVTQEWENLVPGLVAKQYDLVVAAMEITEERRRRIAFSAPYAHTPSSLVVDRERTLAGVDAGALKELRVGVEAESAQQAYFEDKLPNVELRRYATLEAAMLDLSEDRIDVVADDKLAAVEFLKNRREGRCCRIAADLPQDADYFGAGLGVGLRQEDSALKSSVDAALAAIIADGTLRAISAKYFDFEIY
ncbi:MULTISPECIES: transporter substrate-binding domain-containing protein [Methylosinus]|uniref:ABC transporter substrate-binding protein n=1 Tax=Methylosinus trichosporium (strain ATCC 35070 / NCIMB 11131 / UNIQEM 75 / OB3b) TaxID=595536 RepID=A0A2D2D101_METT3|nr:MULTISPECIES: transporter substrate-binding domain-containing protein [Methylosinus]ATQ68549.1 ABC transporter substrate-binding protein [Methylosinus trichosporium OB3b]OBS52797.1 ABC transporter substrate-binding protein [Methylosinus sp. 3S-1]